MKSPTPQPDPARITRRAFVARSAASAAAIAAPYIVRPSALGLGAAVAPSNRITLGFIGIGMMGQGHLRHCLHYPAGNWKPVPAPSGYPCKKDTYNRASFNPTKTTALRLEAKLPARFSSGILEWKVK